MNVSQPGPDNCHTPLFRSAQDGAKYAFGRGEFRCIPRRDEARATQISAKFLGGEEKVLTPVQDARVPGEAPSGGGRRRTWRYVEDRRGDGRQS
jgi:hypothetical protein